MRKKWCGYIMIEGISSVTLEALRELMNKSNRSMGEFLDEDGGTMICTENGKGYLEMPSSLRDSVLDFVEQMDYE